MYRKYNIKNSIKYSEGSWIRGTEAARTMVDQGSEQKDSAAEDSKSSRSGEEGKAVSRGQLTVEGRGLKQ